MRYCDLTVLSFSSLLRFDLTIDVSRYGALAFSNVSVLNTRRVTFRNYDANVFASRLSLPSAGSFACDPADLAKTVNGQLCNSTFVREGSSDLSSGSATFPVDEFPEEFDGAVGGGSSGAAMNFGGRAICLVLFSILMLILE